MDLHVSAALYTTWNTQALALSMTKVHLEFHQPALLLGQSSRYEIGPSSTQPCGPLHILSPRRISSTAGLKNKKQMGEEKERKNQSQREPGHCSNKPI
jgi:hypothetical protein